MNDRSRSLSGSCTWLSIPFLATEFIMTVICFCWATLRVSCLTLCDNGWHRIGETTSSPTWFIISHHNHKNPDLPGVSSPSSSSSSPEEWNELLYPLSWTESAAQCKTKGIIVKINHLSVSGCKVLFPNSFCLCHFIRVVILDVTVVIVVLMEEENNIFNLTVYAQNSFHVYSPYTPFGFPWLWYPQAFSLNPWKSMKHLQNHNDDVVTGVTVPSLCQLQNRLFITETAKNSWKSRRNH